MPVLSLNLLLYTIAGVWRPIEWTSNWYRLLYKIYTFFAIYLMKFIVLAQFLHIVFMVDNFDDFISEFFIHISIINANFKFYTAIIHRDRIVNLIETLQREPCEPCNKEEIDIQEKFEYFIRWFSIKYISLVCLAITSSFVGGTLEALQGNVPFGVWLPYETSLPFVLWFTVIEVYSAVLIAGIVSIAADTSTFGFCLQTCAQLEILKHRLLRAVTYDNRGDTPECSSNGAPRKASVFSKHVCHHLRIIRFTQIFNKAYNEVFFAQFLISILAICLFIYYSSTKIRRTGVDFLVAYGMSLFVQIFIYCWAGNEIILKSAGLMEVVYEMDWVLLTTSERRDLLMIMKRSAKPIKITSSFLVTLSLESYCNILKASYSAFSVLNH